MPRMNQEEMDAFLTGVKFCKLACLESDGSPYIVPLNYFYLDGGFYLYGRGRAGWASYLQQDGRVCLSIEADGKRVQVKGHAEVLNEPAIGTGRLDGLVREALEHAGRSDYYLAMHTHEPMWGFFVRPIKMTSWQGGEWAKRYKHAEW